ncbi:MAG: ABC transporter ATP-binding protein [Peptoniphilaceae bacterium]|nr:ABC transporter ATP-binding protein [Peptoniphilaceae bacterium]MDY6019139.1 ABC transporter ATP-binding protein [Anaerococcus sp.]
MKIDFKKKVAIVFHGIFLIAISILMVAYPVYIAKFIDNISNVNILKDIVLIIIGLIVSKLILNIFDNLLTLYLTSELDYEMKKTIAKKLLFCSYLDLVKEEEGRLLNLNNDIDVLIDFYINFLTIIIKNFLMLCGIFIVSISKFSYFSIVYIAMLLILFVLFNKIKASSYVKFENTKNTFDKMISIFHETFVTFEEFYFIKKDKFLVSRLRKAIDTYFDFDLVSNFISYEYWLSSIFVFTSMKIAAMILGFFLIPKNLISIGALYLFIYYIEMIEDPIMEIRLKLETVPNIKLSKERLVKVLRLKDISYGPKTIDKKLETIDLDKLSFSFGDKKIFDNYKMELSQKIYVLKGPSGSGKSTLINLICRLFDPSDGFVRYNGIDIKNFKKNEINRKIEYIDQRLDLDNKKTVEDVIVKDGESIKLLREFSINKSFNTPLSQLSNGEYRSLYLIKTLKSSKDILIMDEIFLGLEDDKCDKFFDLAKNLKKIIIIISHEKRIIDRADEVISLGKN